MQRLRDERGAVAVMVGLLIVPLIGFAAIAVDLSAMWAEKRQVQNGADAGALAIAQACARGETCTDASANASAQGYAVSNRNGGTAGGTAKLAPGKVTVTTSDPHEHWFARVFGSNQSDVKARAVAKWGGPVSGTTLPLTFSKCSWDQQSGGLGSTTPVTILFSKTAPGCTGPSGLNIPGGFAWVDTSAGCTKSSIIGGYLDSDTGNTPSAGCGTADFAAMLNKVILIPIFDQDTGTGQTGKYRVYGYAAFKMTGYNFGGSFKTSPAPCSGNNRCVAGYFTRYVDLNEVLDIGTGPQLGLSIITLED